MTDTTTLKAAILVVSDTASQDPSTDKVGDALTNVLSTAGPNTWDKPVIKIVPDSVLDIQRAICDWADGPNWVNLICVSGGTGFAAKDITPEVRLLSTLASTPSFTLTLRSGGLASDPSLCVWPGVSHVSNLHF